MCPLHLELPDTKLIKTVNNKNYVNTRNVRFSGVWRYHARVYDFFRPFAGLVACLEGHCSLESRAKQKQGLVRDNAYCQHGRDLRNYLHIFLFKEKRSRKLNASSNVVFVNQG